jgi:Ser/Thr protein kinase RdoA (MazF antagonist)
MKNNFYFPALEHPAPTCDHLRALDLAKNWLELDQNAIATPFVSEKDQNFLISTSKERAILKISNHKEEKGVLEFQTDALLHLEKTTNLNLPKAKKKFDGEYLFQTEVGGKDCYIRMLTYIEGEPLDGFKGNILDLKSLHISMGSFLAKMGIGLEDFSHPHENHRLLWDVTQTESLFDILGNVKDEQKRKTAELALIYSQNNTKGL